MRKKLRIFWAFFLVSALQNGFTTLHQMASVAANEKDSAFLPLPMPMPELYPNSQPLIPQLAPSPLSPFLNNSTPKLSGKCMLNFSAVNSLMRTTAVDCWTSFAPFLANVICCPQLRATTHILIGQASIESNVLSLDITHANYCLSDIQQILGSQGASYDLVEVCSIHPSNFTEGTCPVKDTDEFESLVDSTQLLAACKKVDAVNECCSQICQNAILDAARKISSKNGGLPSMDVNSNDMMLAHTSRLDDCRNVVLRWLSSRLDFSSANQMLRRISNCNVNGVCPLVFPSVKGVAKRCGNLIKNQSACCHSMSRYVSHLQKQSFITNLQALDCAALLGHKLQEMNVSTNIYTFCEVTLKDFSLQVGSQESGCLLPSLPSDATFDPSTGISFTCDLNDNIAAPWPSASVGSSSTCNKSVNLPALPAATSSHTGDFRDTKLQLQVLVLLALVMLI